MHPTSGRGQVSDAAARRLTALARGLDAMCPSSSPGADIDVLAALGGLGWSRLDEGAWRLVNADGIFVALADPPAVVRLPPPGIDAEYVTIPVNTFVSPERLLEVARDGLVDFARRTELYGPLAIASAAAAAWSGDEAAVTVWAFVVLATALDPRLEKEDAARAQRDYKAVARLLDWARCEQCWWRHQPGECVTRFHALPREPGWVNNGGAWQLDAGKHSIQVFATAAQDAPPCLIVMPPAVGTTACSEPWSPFAVAAPLSDDGRFDVRFVPLADSGRMWCVGCGCPRPMTSDASWPCPICSSTASNQSFDPELLAVCAYAHDETSLVAAALDYSAYLRAIMHPESHPIH